MTAVTLPTTPGPRSVAWELVDFGGTLQGPLGGSGQRVNRLGNRWRAHIEMPVMTIAQAREWSASLTRGLRLGVLWRVRQPGFSPGSPGTPLVNGASQAGSQLDCDGFNPGYTARAGQWFSALISSQRYLYQVASTQMADASGVMANLEIEPVLRVSPANNDTLEFAVPYLQGLLDEPAGWGFEPDKLARGFVFTITESR